MSDERPLWEIGAAASNARYAAKHAAILERHRAGETVAAIAVAVGVSRPTVRAVIRRAARA